MISWKLKTRTQRPIGLDIGHHSIKMIQLAISGGHINVLAADKIRIDPCIKDDAEARLSIVSTIKQILAEGKFRGRNVVSCLPNDRLKITSLRLAEGESEWLEQALGKEAARRFGLDPAKDVINYMFAGNVRQGDETKDELILFATDNEAIKSHITMLEEAQLRLVAIDTIPCALFRCFERFLRRQEDKERTVVFVDVGSRSTTVVFGRGGEIRFVKQIPISGERFNRDIAAKLGIKVDEAEMLRGRLRMENGLSAPESNSTAQAPVNNGQRLDAPTRQAMVDAISAIAEELAKEISLCLRYYTVTFRGKRVERAILTGGEAYENILLDVLRRQLAVVMEVAQPLRGVGMMNVNFDSSNRDLLCEWAVAMGLSLKGWSGATGEGDWATTPENVFEDPDNYEGN